MHTSDPHLHQLGSYIGITTWAEIGRNERAVMVMMYRCKLRLPALLKRCSMASPCKTGATTCSRVSRLLLFFGRLELASWCNGIHQKQVVFRSSGSRRRASVAVASRGGSSRGWHRRAGGCFVAAALWAGRPGPDLDMLHFKAGAGPGGHRRIPVGSAAKASKPAPGGGEQDGNAGQDGNMFKKACKACTQLAWHACVHGFAS